MSQHHKVRGCIIIFVAFITVFIILATPFGATVVFVYFPILFFAIVAGICNASCYKESHEQNGGATQQDVPQLPTQNVSTPQNQDLTEVNLDNFCSRSSVGRILLPFGDEEPSNGGDSFPNEVDSSLVCAADFGDDEVLVVDESACPICLVDYQHGDEIQRNGLLTTSGEGTMCDHIFHSDCILKWIYSSGRSECPICRGPFHVSKPPAA